MIPKGRATVYALVVSASALVGIANYESYRDAAYIPVLGDVPTIGFGSTEGVKLGQKTTPERALIRLLADADRHANGIRRCINVPLYQYEFDAYLSLTYNIGVDAFCRSTLNKLLNQSEYEGACKQILRWNRQGGRVLPGLTVRRESEYRQCMGA